MENFLNRHYEALVAYASLYTKDPHDLVHFTYLKLLDANFTYVSDLTALAYFKKSIYNSSRGDFKKLYYPDDYKDVDVETLEVENLDLTNLDRRIAREKLDEVVRHLDFFDRTIFEMYLRGDNLKKVSRESGISYATMMGSIYRIRKTLKESL